VYVVAPGVEVTAGGASGWNSTAPMSTRGPVTRVNTPPRWSVVSPAGSWSPGVPALTSRLPLAGAIVAVGPPLFWSDPSWRLAPGPTLFPLVPDSVYPAAVPTALKLAFAVPPVWRSGAAAAAFPATTVFWSVTRARPGRPAGPGDPAAGGRGVPGDRGVLNQQRVVEAPQGHPPPDPVAVLLAIVLFKITRVPAVNPAGGDAAAAPEKSIPRRRSRPRCFTEIVLFRTTSDPPAANAMPPAVPARARGPVPGHGGVGQQQGAACLQEHATAGPGDYTTGDGQPARAPRSPRPR